MSPSQNNNQAKHLDLYDPSSEAEELEESEAPDLDQMMAEVDQELTAQEAEEKQEKSEPPTEASNLQLHAILFRPDGFPLCESFSDPNQLAAWIVRQTRVPRLVGELSLWRAYAFRGEVLAMRGDLTIGELYVELDDNLYSAFGADDESLPPMLSEGALSPVRENVDDQSDLRDLPGTSGSMEDEGLGGGGW